MRPTLHDASSGGTGISSTASSWIVRLGVIALLATAFVIASSTPRAEAATTVVAVGDFWFCNSGFANGVCPTSIAVGDTVEWDFTPSIFTHTSTDCGPDCNTGPFGGVWDSGFIPGGGGPFQFTFNSPGVYPYYCTIHPTSMQGEITVSAAVGGIAQLPLSAATPLGAQTSEGGVDFVTVPVVSAVAGIALIASAAVVRRRLLS